MANKLLYSLLSRPSTSFDPESDVYNGSISCARFYLNALAEAEDINQNIHIVGFDVDQIWTQSRLLLGSIPSPTYFTSTTKADMENGPPKKRLRHYKEPKPTQFIGPKHDESATVDGIEGTEGLLSESSVSEIEVNGIEHPYKSSNDRDGLTARTHNRLDDGFFSIDAFNLETEKFERADELGHSFDELGMTIDWNIDPDEDLSSDSSQGAVMYTDFFLPPKHSGNLEIDKDTDASQRMEPQDADFSSPEGIGRIMNEIEEDLFDGGEGAMFSDNDSASKASESMDQSSHSNVQARLSNRIRELEKQNISQREWTLSGEANSKQRPFNSLLEEDLDFERIGKPVPVVTQESTLTLEDMIKDRILSGQFDGILRKSLGIYETSRRSVVELDDSKPRAGLAEEYEQEHIGLKPSGQSKNVDMKADVLRSEISGLFSVVSNQLDMLSSWHFTPKAQQATLSIVHDVRTLNMEEAQVNSNHLSRPMSTALAPHEIYNTARKANQSDGVIKVSGIPMSLSEVERGKRAKRKARKGRGAPDPSQAESRGNKDLRVLKTLQKADVAVIDKDGKRQSLVGGSRPERGLSSGSRIKL